MDRLLWYKGRKSKIGILNFNEGKYNQTFLRGHIMNQIKQLAPEEKPQIVLPISMQCSEGKPMPAADWTEVNLISAVVRSGYPQDKIAMSVIWIGWLWCSVFLILIKLLWIHQGLHYFVLTFCKTHLPPFSFFSIQLKFLIWSIWLC